MNYSNNHSNANEYPALKALMFWFKLLGVLVIVLAILSLLVLLTAEGEVTIFSILIAIGIIVGGIITGLFLFGFAELLKVFINTERNTSVNYSINKSLEEMKKNIDILLLKQIDNDI